MEQLNFETVPAAQVAGLETDDETVERARVPGGWIVIYDHRQRVTFCADVPPEKPVQPPRDLRLVA
jgi:hypothetical protein